MEENKVVDAPVKKDDTAVNARASRRRSNSRSWSYAASEALIFQRAPRQAAWEN